MKKRMWIGVFAFLLGGMVEGCVSDQRVAEVEQASRMERATSRISTTWTSTSTVARSGSN